LDTYSENADHLGDELKWKQGKPEDHAIYVSHVWVYGGDCVDPSPSPDPSPTPDPSPQPSPTPEPCPESPKIPEDSTCVPSEPWNPPLECPEGYVPGWLDENGDPTSCVGDF